MGGQSAACKTPYNFTHHPLRVPLLLLLFQEKGEVVSNNCGLILIYWLGPPLVLPWTCSQWLYTIRLEAHPLSCFKVIRKVTLELKTQHGYYIYNEVPIAQIYLRRSDNGYTCLHLIWPNTWDRLLDVWEHVYIASFNCIFHRNLAYIMHFPGFSWRR